MDLLVGATHILKPLSQDADLFLFNLADRQIRDLTPQTKVSARIEKLVLNIRDETTKDGQIQLHAQSPVYFTDQITKPLLITHGALDTNVPRNYSDNFVGVRTIQQ